MEHLKTEVLIIGSGFGAAPPALRLSEAGYKVLMIEKGLNVVPHKDFKMTQDPKYILKYITSMENKNISFTYAEALGGGSGFYEMVSLRAPSKVFNQMDETGKYYWPSGINRRVLDTYYDITENMMNVKQISKEDIPVSGLVFSQMMRNLGYSCDRARYAVKGCVGSGYCITGCVFGAKQSLHFNYLPQAKAAGMKIIANLEALSIRPLFSNLNSTRNNKSLSSIPYRYVVKCKDLSKNELVNIDTKLIILGGGTIGTAKLLLNSRHYLHFLSNQIGKNIAFNGSIKAIGLLPEESINVDMFTGRSHPGMISYHFLESRGITISSAKPLPLYFVSSARFKLEGEKSSPSYWGLPNVDLMKKYRRRMIVLYALGLTPPVAELHSNNSGKITPKLNLDSETKNYYSSTKNLLYHILRKNNCKVVYHTMVNSEGQPKNDIFFSTTHMVGSCRMADNIKNGVVDAHGEVFNYPGIYITDGATIPTSLAVNSSLTITANAERIAEHIVNRFTMVQNKKKIKSYNLSDN